MDAQQIVSPTFRAVAKKTVQAVTRFAKLERVLAFVCALTPLLLILADHGQVRASVSAYYNMHENQLFYFPLTVASMLFVVNGVVKDKHIYNSYLGAMLAGVILFNLDDFVKLHTTFAVGFFGGNGVVMVLYSSKKELWFKLLLVAIIALSIVGWLLGWYSLFWAEWVSLGIITWHYILESWGVID